MHERGPACLFNILFDPAICLKVTAGPVSYYFGAGEKFILLYN